MRQRGAAWLVPSQSGRGGYAVAFDGARWRCDRPHHEYRQKDCKHILAVSIVVTQIEHTTTTTEKPKPDGTRTVTTNSVTTTTTRIKRTTNRQEWPQYNAAKTREEALLMDLLRDPCAGVPQPGSTWAASGSSWPMSSSRLPSRTTPPSPGAAS